MYQSHTLPSPNMSHRSDQSRGRSERSHSQKSTRSYVSNQSSANGIPVMEARGLEAAHIVDQLQKEIVFLTGGRDRQGGPLLMFPPHRDEYFLPNDIAICLQYLAKIPSEESKRRGFTAIIDSRDGSWSNLVTLLGCLKQSLGDYLKQVLVLRTDGSGQRQSNSSSFRRDRGPNIEPQFVNLNRLHTFVDRNQLVGSMGGSLMYNHRYWLQNRLDLEKFFREYRAATSHLDTSESEMTHRYRNQAPESPTTPIEALRQHGFFQDHIMSVPTQVIQQGRELLDKLQQYSDTSVQGMEAVTTLDNLEAQKQVKRMMQYLDNRLDKIRSYLEDKGHVLKANMLRDDVQREFRQVVEWILGPGEKLLASQSDIGDSFETAEALRKRHEELEIKCTDTYGHYAELRHRSEDLIKQHDNSSEDILAQRDYMDTVCRSFASRLERRRTLLITSVRFHRLTEEFARKLDDLLGFLYNDREPDTIQLAQEALTVLQDKVDAIDTAASRAMQDGHSLLDEMSRPIKNAFGKDISPDYDLQIKHVTQHLEELQERKMRCDDLADVRKLKLQQILQLRNCESDADQAITWILELCDVMVSTHTNMGQTLQEAESLQDEHKKFETTARGTYDYGKQLLHAALVLRRSLRYNVEPNNIRVQQLEEAWKRFSTGTNERSNRLTVGSMFLAQSDKLIEKMDHLMVIVAQTLTGDLSVRDAVSNYGPLKHEIGRDHGDTAQMGKALLERLALPMIIVDGNEKQLTIDEQGATETVNGRLRKMDHKMAEINRYWQEMEQTGQPPSVYPKITRSFQPFPGDEGQMSSQKLSVPHRSQSQRSKKSQPPSYPSNEHPSRAQSFNRPESHSKSRKRPITRGDRRRRTVDAETSEKPTPDTTDTLLYSDHQPVVVEEASVHPQLSNGQQSQPHVSQSYYPISDDFARNIPPTNYTYVQPPEPPPIEPTDNVIQPDVSDSVHSQIQPDISYTSHSEPQSDSSQQYQPQPQPSPVVSKEPESETKSNIPTRSTSKRSIPSFLPDTLPMSHSRPDVVRPAERKFEPSRQFLSRRSESPPLSFQDLLMRFSENKPGEQVESKEKREVQVELANVLKSRAEDYGDEDDLEQLWPGIQQRSTEQPLSSEWYGSLKQPVREEETATVEPVSMGEPPRMEQKSDLQIELEEVSVCTKIYPYIVLKPCLL